MYMYVVRYIYAGGRYRQVPKLFSFIHGKRLTPILAVALLVSERVVSYSCASHDVRF